LRFGDTGSSSEEGYHTLGKLLCWDWAHGLYPIIIIM
jgi:hypothetical protein